MREQRTSAERVGSMGARRVVLVALLAVAMGGGGGWYGWASSTGAGHREVGRVQSGEAPGGRGHHDHGAGVVEIPARAMEEFGISVGEVGPGTLVREVSLPGEIVLDPDRVAHLSPRVEGVVVSVAKSLGDPVASGEVMVVLESRELADAKAAYLAAMARLDLARTTHEREERLHSARVSSRRELLEARQALEVAEIELRSARLRLFAMGVSKVDLDALRGAKDRFVARLELVAPFPGTIIRKHVVVGERLEPGSVPFVVADLDEVWAELRGSPGVAPELRVGQEVRVRDEAGGVEAVARVGLVEPVVDRDTRSAKVIVRLDNRGRRWKPGTFVTGALVVGRVTVPVALPLDAVVRQRGRSVAYVRVEGGFVPRTLVVGRRDGRLVEVVSGLDPGERVALRGAFTIEAEAKEGTFGHGHDH